VRPMNTAALSMATVLGTPTMAQTFDGSTVGRLR
jgi:hypothetical protein